MANSKFKVLRNILQGNTAKYKIPTERPTLRLQRQAFESFYKAASTLYQSQLRGNTERLDRLKDYDEMDLVPEISKTLDIFADDSLTYNESGQVLAIVTDDSKIKSALEELYYEILDVDFHLWHWVRNLCKYGDHFNLLDVVEGEGVLGALELPVGEIEREEGFDNDPNSLRFKWMAQHGGADYFENYQVSHMRILGEDKFLPYGKSILDPGRKLYKQLIMAEDAMLIYRITRAPERRVFYIDVANIPPKDVDSFIQKARDALKRSTNIRNPNTGTLDMRYNPESILEDFFIPVRGDRSSRIETLPGGDNASAIEDIQYLQNKLFIALGVPKSYLTAEEDLSGKSTLAQEDIKFARTIQRVQKIVVSELAKIGLVHLYLKGYDQMDIYNFDLKLTNPSSVTELMQLELIEKRLDIAERMHASPLFANEYAQKNIMKLTESEISEFKLKAVEEAKEQFKLEQIATGGANDPEYQMEMGGEMEGGYDEEGGGEEGAPPSGESKRMADRETADDNLGFPYDPTGTKHLKGYPDLESSVPNSDDPFDKIFDDNDSSELLVIKKRGGNNKDLLSRTITDIKKHDRGLKGVLSKLGEDVNGGFLSESQIKNTNFVKNK
jgi:hypothetical protein